MVAQNTTASVPPTTQAAAGQALWRMITGYFVSQAIYVAAKLGIADLLEQGPQSITALAQATSTHAPSLYRLMRALASVGVFAEGEQGYFKLTPMADCLRKNVAGSMQAGAMLVGSRIQWQTLGHLLYSVQTGESAFDDLFGMNLWEYIEQHSEESETFQHAMSAFSTAEITAILSAYDFSSFHTISDIAGGQGKLLTAILNKYPDMHGVLFDLPHVVRDTKATLEAAGVAQRCTVAEGDMFVSVPAGHDAYIMKTVIHNWDDQQAIKLLKSCAAGMPAHARLLLITRIITPGNVPDSSKFMDLNMLVTLGGCERTEAEFETLLAAAGLQQSRIVPTRSYLSIIECVKR